VLEEEDNYQILKNSRRLIPKRSTHKESTIITPAGLTNGLSSQDDIDITIAYEKKKLLLMEKPSVLTQL